MKELLRIVAFFLITAIWVLSCVWVYNACAYWGAGKTASFFLTCCYVCITVMYVMLLAEKI